MLYSVFHLPENNVKEIFGRKKEGSNVKGLQNRIKDWSQNIFEVVQFHYFFYKGGKYDFNLGRL